MTKLIYDLPEKKNLIVDYDEKTRLCTINETLLYGLISKLNYYADMVESEDEE